MAPARGGEAGRFLGVAGRRLRPAFLEDAGRVEEDMPGENGDLDRGGSYVGRLAHQAISDTERQDAHGLPPVGTRRRPCPPCAENATARVACRTMDDHGPNAFLT